MLKDEYKPFVPHLHSKNQHQNSIHKQNKYMVKDSDYAFAYASPVSRTWHQNDQNGKFHDFYSRTKGTNEYLLWKSVLAFDYLFRNMFQYFGEFHHKYYI